MNFQMNEIQTIESEHGDLRAVRHGEVGGLAGKDSVNAMEGKRMHGKQVQRAIWHVLHTV